MKKSQTQINITPRLRLPQWVKTGRFHGPNLSEVGKLVRTHGLHTVCEEARCPNIWDCWNRRTATLMILGEICTRSCGFCSVTTGKPAELDLEEPLRVAEAVRTLGLRHAVITSVDRDDLPDGGSEVFARTIEETRRLNPECIVEVLVPDFKGDPNAVNRILTAGHKDSLCGSPSIHPELVEGPTGLATGPDIFSHNMETVRRLHPTVRPQAKYQRSLDVLHQAVREKTTGMRVKTGMMLGLGETLDEVREVMRDLRSVGVQLLTLGQYLQPTRDNLPVSRYLDPTEFEMLKAEGLSLGFQHVESGPLVRSSYHAEEQARTSREPAGKMKFVTSPETVRRSPP